MSPPAPSSAAEVWLPILGGTGYEVSSIGRVRSIRRTRRTLQNVVRTDKGRILRQAKVGGYCVVTLSFGSAGLHRHSVHRLVASVFIAQADPTKNQVNHLNGNKADNRIENLEWCSCSENHLHAFRFLGRKSVNKRGEDHPRARIKVEDVRQIRASIETRVALAAKYGLSEASIGDIKKRRSWKSVT